MRPKAIILLLAVLTGNAIAAGAPPSGVFTCSGETTTAIKGKSSHYTFDRYKSTIIFPSGKSKKYTMTSETPGYISKGTYWWADDKSIMLRPSARTEAYRKLALHTCKLIGWKCTATTYIGFNVGIDIINDSNIKLGLLNVTNIKANTQQGLLKLEMWTDSRASCIKN